MDKSRWLTPGFAAVICLTALALVVMNHLPGRAPVPQAAPIKPSEAVAHASAHRAPAPAPAAEVDEAQLAAAVAPPPAPPVPMGPRTLDDPRLAPLRHKVVKAHKPRAKLDARAPGETVAAAQAQPQRQQAATNPAAPTNPVAAAVARQALAFVGADPDA